MIKFETIGLWIELAREVCGSGPYILERHNCINILWRVTTAGSPWYQLPKWWY